MASSGKRKTTMAKRERENRLRLRRLEKAARKEARKAAPPEDPIGPDHRINGAAAQLGEHVLVDERGVQPPRAA